MESMCKLPDEFITNYEFWRIKNDPKIVYLNKSDRKNKRNFVEYNIVNKIITLQISIYTTKEILNKEQKNFLKVKLILY
jgi:hypothetical protein